MNTPQILTNKPLLGAKPDLAHPLMRGCKAFYLFNEQTGLRAFDLSPYKNHGKLVNFNDPTSKDRSSLGLDFDGENDYINCGNDPSLDITDAITIGAWVKPAVITGNYMVLRKDFAYFSRIAGSRWVGYIYSGGSWYSCDSTTIPQVDVWQHFVMIYDSSWATKVIKLYVDGTEVNYNTQQTVAGTIDTSANDAILGMHGTTGYPFNGSIDGVKIYNRALSANEILQLYQSPFAMFK